MRRSWSPWTVYAHAWRLTWQTVQSRRMWMTMVTTLGALTMLWVIGLHFAPVVVHWAHSSPTPSPSAPPTLPPESPPSRTWWPWISGAALLGLAFFIGLVPWSTARFYDRLVRELQGTDPPETEPPAASYVRGIVWFVGFFGFWFLWSVLSALSLDVFPWWLTLGLALVLLAWGLPHLFRWFGSVFVDRQRWRQTGAAWRGLQGTGVFWGGVLAIGLSTVLVMGIGWLGFRWSGLSAPWWILLALGLSADLVWESVATIWMVALYIAWRAVPAGSPQSRPSRATVLLPGTEPPTRSMTTQSKEKEEH